MIRSLSSSLCALSSSSADVNTFMLSVRSNRRCRRADRSEVVSQSESESLESEDESAGRARFLAGGRWRGWQSVRQEIWTTRAKSVRKRPKHTPQTKKSAALSGWSVMGEKKKKGFGDFFQETCQTFNGIFVTDVGSPLFSSDLFILLCYKIFSRDGSLTVINICSSYYSLPPARSLGLAKMSHKFCLHCYVLYFFRNVFLHVVNVG